MASGLFASKRRARPVRRRYCKTPGCKYLASMGRETCVACAGIMAPVKGYEKQ